VCLNAGAVPEESALAAIRAAVEAIVPAVDGRPGAVDLGVERHVAQSLEGYVPGFADLLGTLLDAYATDVRAGTAFVDLTLDERGQVLRLMSAEDSGDLRDLVDALLVFTYGGMYSEWTGFDPATGALEPPAVWADMGFAGPVAGHADYRKDA
jgi:hypothetical protein